MPESGTESVSELVFSSILTGKIVHNPLGVIAIVVNGNILQKIIDTQEQKENYFEFFSNVYIISNTSVIIAKTKTADNLSHKNTIDFQAARRISGLSKKYSGIYVNHFGVKVLGTHLFVPQTKWTIIAEKNLKEAFLPLAKLKYIFGIAGGSAAFLILAGTAVISNHLSTDIRKLLTGIKKVTSGNLTQSIAIGKRNDEIEVSVKDTGVGINLPKNQQRKIFDRFFQEKSRNEGVGLGLSICDKIIEAHGGKICVQSSGKDKGSIFKFTLPKPGIEDFCRCTSP
ncbi:MAG: ATP-binding protein [Candidatus Scalindua sp.]|nr:ATP-binding protein [Candidatus Scalindua sp.]